MTIEIVVRPNEIDPYNVVHHSIYLCWYEYAIVEYLRAQEDTLHKDILESYFVKQVNSKYIDAAKVGNHLTIQTDMVKYDNVARTVKFKQQVVNKEQGKVINKAEIVISY